jgi:hypothetical protein
VVTVAIGGSDSCIMPSDIATLIRKEKCIATLLMRELKVVTNYLNC